MAFIDLTRPDGSPVVVNTDEILMLTPAPRPEGASGGPLDGGTRIDFINKTYQDVKEAVDAVAKKLNLVG